MASFGAVLKTSVGSVVLLGLWASDSGSQHAQNPIGVIAGQVVESVSALPVSGAVLRLNQLSDDRGAAVDTRARLAAERAAPHIIAGSDGFFFFRDVTPGRYALTVTAHGYVTSSQTIELKAIGNIEIRRLSVRLQKFASISGRVLDDLGEPVVGVQVSALQQVVVDGSLALRQAFIESLTDDRGVYSLSNLPPGSYVVGVLVSTKTVPARLAQSVAAAARDRSAAFAQRLDTLRMGMDLVTGDGVHVDDFVVQRTGPLAPPGPDGSLMGYATTLSPGTSDPAEASVITLASAEARTGIDISMRLSSTSRVSGTLTGPTGRVARLAISLVPRSAADQTDARPVGLSTTVTNDAGEFTFLAVTPGMYTIKAVLEAGNDVPARTFWDSQALIVGDGGVSDLALSMKPGLAIGGRLEFKGNSGSPARIPQSPVVLRPVGAVIYGTGAATVGPDWTFTTSGNPPGRYFVVAPSIPGWTLQTIARNGAVIVDDVVELGQADLSGVVITYNARPSRISGLVTGAADTATSADVIVFPADTSLWRKGIFSARRERLTHVGLDASFECSAIAPGTYFVVAVPSQIVRNWQDPVFLERLIPGATSVTVGEGDERSVTLRVYDPAGR